MTTLCPCSKAISAYGAHNQRGYVTLALRSVRPIWIEDMISLIEGVREQRNLFAPEAAR